MPHPLPTLRLTWRRLGISELAAHRLAVAQAAIVAGVRS